MEARLGTGAEGLSREEAAQRLERFGPNQLEEQAPTPPIVVLARQFRSPLIYILVAATAVTVLLKEYIDAGVIAFVLALNAVIGFTQERKAEGAVRALMQLVVPHARVVRAGQDWEIDSRTLVPGDVVLLEPGARVPADLRLIGANALQVDESLLTGESLPVTKRTTPVSERAPLADRSSMAYTGSAVTSGRGRGVVVATGPATELGGIAGLIRSEEAAETPLQQRMTAFAKIVGLAVAVASVVASTSGVALGGGVEEMFLTAVALAVAAIPEGLPVVFTIALALGVRRMARRNAIVRRLPAVETLGSTTVIGSDKTGTLTENRMTVQRVWTSGHFFTLAEDGTALLTDGEPISLDEHPGLHRTLLAGVLTNEADVYRTENGLEVTGDPTEAALLVSAMVAGIEPDEAREDYPVFAEIPFEPERRYSATLRSRHGRHILFAKGAPERVAEMCTDMLTEEGMTPIDRQAIAEAAHHMAEDGLRVLGMASRELPERIDDPAQLREPGALVFLGLQVMMDPPRPGVADAGTTCRTAGIRVVMITGDHAVTARAIGRRIGIADEHSEVLADDNFVSISAAVEEGRVTFDNVRKVIFFLISTGAATIAAILFGVWAQWPLVMLPAQLLWLNLVTNGLQDVALAVEPGEPAVLQRPPRSAAEGMVSRLLWERTLIAGLVMAAGTLALFRWELDRTGSLERAQTVALSTMVVYMAFHVGNARSETTSLFRLSPVSNPFLLIATVSALSIHVASLYLGPTQFVLRVEPIEAAAWVRIVAVATSILVAVELHKLIRRRFPIGRSGGPSGDGPGLPSR